MGVTTRSLGEDPSKMVAHCDGGWALRRSACKVSEWSSTSRVILCQWHNFNHEY